MAPAPIAPELLAPALAPLGESTLLPRAAYTDPAVLDWEHRHFFSDWICVGRSEDVPDSGQRAVSAGQTGVLLLRADDGVLRGFVNACRHRGHELLQCGQTSTKRSVVCPYHAWAYERSGDLRHAPGFREVADFDTSRYALQELPLQEWHGWVFVAPGGVASDFTARVGDMESIVAPYGGDKLRVHDSHEYVIEANWKLIVENYQECYHCAMIHPELCRVSPPESGENIVGTDTWTGGWMDLRPDAVTMSMDGSSGSVLIDTLDEQERRTVMYLVVFPNLLLSLHPDYVMTHTLMPVAADRTRIQCSWLFPPAAMEASGFDPSGAIELWDRTNRQDWAACESVQRGLRAEQWVPGPLAPDEDGVHHFVRMVAQRYVSG